MLTTMHLESGTIERGKRVAGRGVGVRWPCYCCENTVQLADTAADADAGAASVSATVWFLFLFL